MRNSWPRYSTASGRRRTTAIRRQILQAQRSPSPLHVLDHRARQLARCTAPPPPPHRGARSSCPSSGTANSSPAVMRPAPVHRVALRRVPQQPVQDPVQIRRAAVSSTPSRASAAAGAASSAHGTVPQRRCAVSRPEHRARHRHRRRARPEVLLRVAVEVHRQLQQLRRRPRSRRHGDEEVQQPRLPVPRVVDEHEPAPAGPVSGLSQTHEVKAAAMHASTAFPPASSTLAPASAVNGWPAAIAPFTPRSLGHITNPNELSGCPYS